jgi:hypothetical protein
MVGRKRDVLDIREILRRLLGAVRRGVTRLNRRAEGQSTPPGWTSNR